jgi:two-component system cell cycle sensor histidine kinase/response regulator CckA
MVESEVGRGTSFTVYLPHVDPSTLSPDEPALSMRPRQGIETILVVEDEAPLRDLTRKLLRRHGYTVLVAASADEALQVFANTATIDVVLTDVVMPGSSGPELARQLVAQRPDLKVIYMSGYTEEAIVHHGVIRPGIAFVHKPFSGASLAAKVREVLGPQRATGTA